MQVHLLFLTAGLLKDKAREKGVVSVYIFSNLFLCLKQDDFKITQRDERKYKKYCIKVSLV